MKRYIVAILSAAIFAGVTTPNATAADKKTDKKPAAKKAKPTKKKRDTYPYRGIISKVNGDSIVLKQKKGARTIAVAKDAKITKDGKKAKLSDIKSGGYVTGSVKKIDGKETAVSVYGKPKPEPRAKKKKPAKKKPTEK